MVSISATSHKKFCHPKEMDIIMDTKENKRVKKIQMSHDMKETALRQQPWQAAPRARSLEGTRVRVIAQWPRNTQSCAENERKNGSDGKAER